MHGKQSLATLDTDSVLFRGMKKVITVARYHSLVADPQTIPTELKVTAVTEDGEVMAVEQTEKQILRSTVPSGIGTDTGWTTDHC